MGETDGSGPRQLTATPHPGWGTWPAPADLLVPRLLVFDSLAPWEEHWRQLGVEPPAVDFAAEFAVVGEAAVTWERLLSLEPRRTLATDAAMRPDGETYVVRLGLEFSDCPVPHVARDPRLAFDAWALPRISEAPIVTRAIQHRECETDEITQWLAMAHELQVDPDLPRAYGPGVGECIEIAGLGFVWNGVVRVEWTEPVELRVELERRPTVTAEGRSPLELAVPPGTWGPMRIISQADAPGAAQVTYTLRLEQHSPPDAAPPETAPCP